MNVTIQSGELSRMMKIAGSCFDTILNAYVELCHNDNLLTIRSIRSDMGVKISCPAMGGDGEKVVVDGKVFSNIIAKCTGSVTISTDGKSCTVKTRGRTKIPLLPVNMASMEEVDGTSVKLNADRFLRAIRKTQYAVCQDQTRMILTGTLYEFRNAPKFGKARFVAIDGNMLALEEVPYESTNSMKVVVPQSITNLVCASVGKNDEIHIITDGKRIEFFTDEVTIIGTLLRGEYLDYEKLFSMNNPETEVRIGREELLDVIKSATVASGSSKLIRLSIAENKLSVSSNSEEADFEAEIDCDVIGKDIRIAFAVHNLMNTMSVLDSDNIILKLNTSVSPMIICEQDTENIHLVMPVHLHGG